MELYQLRYFVAVAETGNFTKAAARSFISQPSLSQQIANLEEELGQSLFHRLGRSVALTQAGHQLLDHARRIIEEADTALREMKESAVSGHRVAAGAIQTVSHFFFPAVLAYCRANEVRLKLRSYENFRGRLVSAVLEGEIDVALVSLPINEPRIVSTPLFSEPLLLAVGASHRLATAERVTFADLKEENFILMGEGSSVAEQVRRISGDHEFEPQIAHRCAQLATVKSLAAMGLGVSILPRSARTAHDPEGLVYRKFTGPAPTRDIVLIHHYRRHLGKGAQLFLDAARAVVGPLHKGETAAPFPVARAKT
jgi:LysR family hydrogen peroxide-inducible transcriptional activator